MSRRSVPLATRAIQSGGEKVITFHDGPAHGVRLFLERAPFYLRITHCFEANKDKWDALDQPADSAEAHESLYLYRVRPTRMGFAFYDGTGKNGRRTGWRSMMADYDYVAAQPADAVMRDNEQWIEWCLEQSLLPAVSAIYNQWKEANKPHGD
jgi:hypothetical protein